MAIHDALLGYLSGFTPCLSFRNGCAWQPKVVVFGGNGYVGSHVCKALLSDGLAAVVSVNRSGQPTSPEWERWWHNVQWVKADVFDPDSWSDALEGATGCAASPPLRCLREACCGVLRGGISRVLLLSAVPTSRVRGGVGLNGGRGAQLWWGGWGAVWLRLHLGLVTCP
jgi:hypothetical protein